MKPVTRAGAAAGTLVVGLVLAACGGADSTAPNRGDTTTPAATSAPSVGSKHNAADVAFAQHMIPHHRQAVMMSELAADRAASEEVTALAKQIAAAQGPEIETMTAFLQAWGEDVPGHGRMEGMDHAGTGMGGMPGMMSPQQMAELRQSRGIGFDRRFLQLMIEHHRGAIEMARIEQADGANQQAIELAARIEAVQADEIARMRELLSTS